MLMAHAHVRAGQRDALTLSRTGTGVIDTAQAKFGTASFKNSAGSQNRIDVTSQELVIGLNDFTVEFWLYKTGNPSSAGGIWCTTNGSAAGVDDTGSGVIYVLTNGNVGYYQQGNISGNNSIDVNTTGFTLSNSAWHHVALCRETISGNTTTRFYLNGVQQGTNTNAGRNYRYGYHRLGHGLGGIANWSAGYIDEFRLSIGICRYPSGTTFTPPISELPNDTYTRLLLHFNGTNGSTTFTDDNQAL